MAFRITIAALLSAVLTFSVAYAQQTNCCDVGTWYCDCSQTGPDCCAVYINGQLPLHADRPTGVTITIIGRTVLGMTCLAEFEEWQEWCSAWLSDSCVNKAVCSACRAPTGCTYWVHLNPDCTPLGGPPQGLQQYAVICSARP